MSKNVELVEKYQKVMNGIDRIIDKVTYEMDLSDQQILDLHLLLVQEIPVLVFGEVKLAEIVKDGGIGDKWIDYQEIKKNVNNKGMKL